MSSIQIQSAKIQVNRKHKYSNRNDLERLSKDELIHKILQLEAHNLQLKNIIEKNSISKSKECGTTKVDLRKKPFDFAKAHKRHTLLKFLYFGWDYQGFASQEDTIATIEYHVFNALQKTCLIQSREQSNYNRCGRTDKKVSAFCQVISIDLRSKFELNEQNNSVNIQNEIDYCGILNCVLPINIKCICWMPLNNPLYSARFDCIQRTYRYFFPAGNLDIEAMRTACKYLIGAHDYRNLCKMDIANGVTNFRRTIYSAKIEICESQSNAKKGYDMYYLLITSKAFMWHQIRCIMSILLLVGERLEDPSIIIDLLNVEQNPCKPQYPVANGIPLNLYSCEFSPKTCEDNYRNSSKEDDDSKNCELTENLENFTSDTNDWSYNQENLDKLVEALQIEWSSYSIKATMIRECIEDLIEKYNENFGLKIFENQAKYLQGPVKQKLYQKLLNRKRCESLENRLNHYVKKQRLILN